MAAMAQNPTDVTGYQTVSVSIPATSYDASQGAPQMALVKYNKTFPLVITSDDMGKTELTNNWAELNGYPVLNNTVDLGIQPGGTAFLQAPLKKYYTQGLSQDVADYAPMTYTDNVGKTQRYRMTCAIMPSNLGSNNYSQIDANDAKLMLRTGFSYAQHDVEDISSVEAITAKFKTNSDKWAQQVGIGLKVMVEPNGNHNYLAAAKESDEICWSIFQNNTSEYPFNSLALTDWTHSRSDWTNAGIGTLPSNFTTKPTGGYARAFFQGNESAWQNTVNNADGTRILIGGTHGLGNTIKDFIRTNSNVKNNAWVAAADEVWEYYHIYNNLKIENVNWDGSNLTLDVQVPTYKKNQFRELTLNIPGLTGGTAPTFSTASGKAMPVTGGYNATGGAGIGYTMNLGMESSITTHIDELMTIYRDDQNNEFVKRDLEYLIAQLWDGTTKSSYTTQLNAAPNYTYNLVANTGETLYTGKTDVSETRQHAVPRYIVQNSTLYETEPNASKPNYVRSANTTVASTPVQYTVKSLSSLAVTGTGALATPEAVLFIEGEDLDGVAVVGADYDINDNSSRYWAMATSSGAMGGSVISGTPVTITSALPRGKYKMVIGYGDSYKGQGTYTYTVNAGGTQVYSFNNSTATNQAVTEFTSSEFSIETGGTAITISSDYTSSTPEKSSRWIDYIYFVKTSSLEPIAPTAAIAASAGTTGAVKINNAITITGTATQNGGSNFSGTNIYRCSDSTGTIDGAAVATSPTETVTYQFTPTAAGTYYFKAVASDGTLGDGTSSVITITAVADIDTYTLNIIDKSGNTAMTATVASADLTADPLAVQYRSPFAKNYKYYNTAAEAQANSGTALTTTADFAQATIYVGYDVDSEKMGADKVHAIWANSRLMHMVLRLNNAHDGVNDYRMNYQKYDIADKGNSDITLHDNLVNTNYALLDNHYMWRLGTDPYNVVLQNVANSRYVKSTYNGNPSAEIAVANANTYCILYWQDKNQNSSVETSAAYCLLYDRTTSSSSNLVYNNTYNHYLACTDNDSYQWRSVDKKHGQYTAGSKFYISTMPEVTVNVLNSHGEVEAQIQAYNNTNATMPNYVPYSMTRAFTSSHALYYDAAHSDAVTMDGTVALSTDKLAANNSNLYLTYTIDNSHWRTVAEGRNANTVMAFDSESDNVKNWYAIGFNNNNYYIQASDNTLPSATSNNDGISNLTGNNANTDTGKKGQWLLMGTPYNLQIVNRYHGDGSRLGIPSDATPSSKPKVYSANSADVFTTWEVATWFSGNHYFFFRPQGAFNAQAPNLYLAQEASVSDRPTGGAKGSVYWAASEEVINPSTVSLTAGSEAPYYVDSPITLTAVATPSPSGTDLVTSLIIEQETSPNVWETVTAAPAYAGSDVTGATKDPTTKAVTLTWQYIPAAAGTFNFRAHAVIDGNDQYSTDATNIGGSGSSLEIIASIRPFVVGSDNYTLILVDKSGNELYTESNVSASRVSELNSVSGRNGDPLNNDWRSPLVVRYNYYTTKADAQSNSGSNLFDWTSTAATPTVYVGYAVGNTIDLNTGLTNIYERVSRSNDDNTQVRNAAHFGTMYMLKFHNGVNDYLENGKDAVETTPKKPIYPYANGDGQMYIYDAARWIEQSNGGNSTRTRWAWYLLSPTNDPYHVYVTAWQQSHANSSNNTSYYNFLRTYYNTTINQLVTTTISDDPKVKDTNITGGAETNVPSEYMLLGTTGYYKLVTSDAVSGATADATYGAHQTVKTLEQYWKNNPTASTILNEANKGVGSQNVDYTLSSDQKAVLEAKQWHTYQSWANAAPWNDSSTGGKTFDYGWHWYKTFDMGDGTFDLEPTEIDAVLVLVDNHGWEVMRQPIPKYKEADKYAAVKAILKQYDSPMVQEYRFYASKTVDHKVSGYHKYRINDNTDKALTESQRVNGETVFTSLADYPEKYSGGALTDLYVTYVVKPAYANSYVGAPTEAGTSASKFIVRQGTKYAQASGASIVSADAADSSDDTFMWYLKPNFNIDTEMGFRYDVDINGKNEGMDGFISVLNELQTNTNYYTYNRQGFDPYNLRIQNVSTETYFTTNAKEYGNYAYAATYPSGGGQVTLTDASTVVNAGGYEVNEELNISNATFMAVQDSNGNMRLMPRFDIDHVIDNFSTLAAPAAAQPVNDESHSQTTLFSVPMTYHIINNAGKEVLVTSVANATSLEVPDNIKSPWVSAYYYHTDSLHAATAATRTTSNVSGFPSDVYVSYTVDAAKMAAGKEYAIFSGVDSVFMHPVFRETQSHSGYMNLQYRYIINKDQKYDEEYDNDMPSNLISAKNLPFVDNTYMWSLGDDPYNIQIVNNHIDSWKYIKQNHNVAAATGDASLVETTADASTFCLLYWNGDTSSDYLTLRYVEPASETEKYITDASQRYMIYDSGNNSGRWVHGFDLGSDVAKMVIKELPDLNVNVVNAAGMVEYTLQGHYVEGAKVPGFTPYFLQRSYTSGHTYYYDSACESQMTAGAAIDNISFDGSNIYVRYNLDASWNTEDLFLVSDTENKHWYNLYYSGKGEYLYANANNNINGISDGTDQTSHFAIYGTPYALRMENRANSGYYIGIPTVVTPSTDAKVYNSFDNIISTWELSAYVKTGANSIGNLANVPFIRPQGSISRETPLLYLRPNTGNKALADTDSKENRVTFVNALRLHLIIIDKAGNQKLDDYVSGDDIDTRNGDPLSNSLRSPYAKNYKYYTDIADAQANNGSNEVTGVSALQGYLDDTLYVGYDVITAENAQQGETPLKMDGATPYRIRRNADNSQVWHATFSPSQAYNRYSNYGWLLINQTKDYSDNSASTVNYNTLPFIDRSWAWEMVSEDGDPYNVKFRNQANGLYVSSENNSNTNYKAIFTSDAANASVFSLLYQNDNKPQYLALYEGNRQKYVYYNNSDGGRWCLDNNRKSSSDGNGDIHISELDVPLDINIVRPAGYDGAREVEAVIHGYRNNSVGANTMQSFVPYYLTRAYTSDQKFYYTKAAAAVAAENTEIAFGATINDSSITDGNSDGVKDIYVSYTLDGTNWLASASSLTSEDKTANASIIKPVTSSDNGMANWYAIRSYNNNNNYFRADSNDLPAALTRTGSAIDNSSIGIEGNGTTASAEAFTNATAIESDYMRRAEWAFIGTPYSLRLIERKHGMMGYLGMTDDATNSSWAYVYATGTDDVVTTFEMVTGLNNITDRMFIRPQGSLNGQTPYLYLGGNDNNMPLSPGADAAHSLDFTWVTEAELETTQPVTIQLYDANGNLVMTHESDMITGTTLSSGTLPASMLRQFCTYTMYSSRDSETGVLSNEIADITIDEPKTVYVQWGYSDNAPVFCQGTDTTQYQYYSMRKDLSGLLIVRNTNGSYEVGVTSNTDEIANRMTQWALVGNPYDLKVFSRGLHQYVSLTAYNTSDNNTFAFVQDMAQADSWQMPLYHDRDNDGTDDVDDYCYYLELKEHTGMYYGQSKLSATRIELRSQHLMLPVNVYRNGEKIDTCEIIIDLFRSLSDRIPQNAITLITEDMLGTNDYLAQTDGRRNYRNPLWMHAFCNYTYYNDSELTIRVPESGLSVFGGAEQRLRALHATYMVDDEQFSQVYLLDFINNNEHHYIGKASNAITLDAVSTRETARSKESRLYKWVFVGDPYDLRITNQETGENITLASRTTVSTGSTRPSVDNGLTFQLTEDTVTNKNYRWEMIDCGDGKVKFYMLPNTNVANRYESGITGYSGTIPLFVRTGLTQYPMHLDNVYAQDCILDYAYPQYNLVWTVVDPNTKQVVAQMRKEHVVENRVIRSEDMPDALRRHFLEYNTMYANQPVTAVAVGGTAVYENSDLVPNNTYTVSTALPDGTTPTEDTDIYLYMPYTYDSGVPGFLDATPDGSTGEIYWYEIHFPGNNKYLYYKDGILSHSNHSVENIRNSQADLSSDGVTYVPYDCYRWALVGNPYSVKFYNKSTGSYLTTDGTALSLTAEGTVFDLMDDASGDLCDILDEVTGVYVNCTAGVQKSNYYYGTSAEFTNTNGVVRIKFVLHYSDNTMRKYDSNSDNTLDASSAGTTEIITVDTYQKLGKNIIDVLPTAWKRAFCDYTFHWDASTTLETTTQATVTTVDKNMVDAYNERRTNPDPYLDVHVTYDYETNAPFKWSTPTTDRTGKYWYYMVNNHARSGNSGGKMIFRDTGANLRISRDLKDDELYLNNFEWCVIGDPYGFKLLNRYDPDQRYDEYISETSLVDASSGCNMFEQDPGNPKNIYEMMPGLYSENFWLHPIYSTEMLDETDTDINYNGYEGYSYMGQNYNGSAAIKQLALMKKLRSNASANYRLEVRSDATLKEYMDYAGFVGALKYDIANNDAMTIGEDVVDVSAIKTALDNDNATDEQKRIVQELINDPDNIEQMTQGYYRLIPYTWEYNNGERRYVRGYLDANEKSKSGGMNDNMKVETGALAEYDPASILWFERTSVHDNDIDRDFPRYYVKTQGLDLAGNSLSDYSENDYKCRYEDLGASIMQLKTSDTALREYLGCAGGDETSTNHCFDEQAGRYKTRFYLQKVGSANENELPYRKSCSFANGTAFEDNDYYYTSFYVPYDILLPEGAKAYIGREENRKEEDDYRLRCYSVDWYYDGEGYSDYQELDNRFVPGGVPVVVKYEKSKIGNDDGFNDTDNSFPVTLPNNAPTAIPDAMKGKHEDATNGQNNLHGSYLTDYVTGLNADQMVYVFTKSNKGNIGFFFNNNTLPDGVTPSATYNSNTYILHNRIYYIYTLGGALTSKPVIIQFMDEEPGIDTDIETIDVNGANGGQRFNIDDDGWYTLHGVRLKEKPSQRGVYIYKGRKVVVK